MSFDYFYGPDDTEQYSSFIRSDTFLIYRNPPDVHHNKLMFIMPEAGHFPSSFSKTISQTIHNMGDDKQGGGLDNEEELNRAGDDPG